MLKEIKYRLIFTCGCCSYCARIYSIYSNNATLINDFDSLHREQKLLIKYYDINSLTYLFAQNLLFQVLNFYVESRIFFASYKFLFAN